MGKVINKRRVVVDDAAELSLGPSLAGLAAAAAESRDSSVSELFETNTCRKRKHSWSEASSQTSVELQLNDPLPLDWEQCLDLQSGKMYYMDRKTLKKSLVRPKEEKLDLELNISTLPSSGTSAAAIPLLDQHYKKYYNNNNNNSSGNMVAVACLNCHLLVMLCKSSPSCPNCKYVHPLPLPLPPPPPRQVKSSETLSLLH